MALVMGSVRAVAKKVVEAVLRCAAELGPQRAPERQLLVLAYHGVTPRGEPEAGERGLHVSQALLVAQLEEVARRADVVPLDEVLRPAARDRPRVAITFDDAYAGTVDVGVAELGRLGLPATLFVCSALVGGGAFWWDRIAEHHGGAIPPQVRDRCLTELRGIQTVIERDPALLGACQTPLPPHLKPATSEQLRSARRTAGIALASHTATHPNLTRLSPVELAPELGPSLAALRASHGEVIPWLAYPYGLENTVVQEAAKAAGFVGAVRIGGSRRMRWESMPHAVARLNVASGLSTNGFVLRLAGWFGE